MGSSLGEVLHSTDRSSFPRSHVRRLLLGRLLLWVSFVALLVTPVWWGIDPVSPWDLDSLAPGPALKALSTGYGPKWHERYGPIQYPPVPYYAIGAAYAPALAVMKLAGELGSPSGAYPWGMKHPERGMGALVVCARLVTLLLAIGIVILAARAEGARSGARGLPVTLLLFLGSPIFFFYARTGNVDVHYLFWLWLGFHLLESAAGRARWQLGAASAAVLAVCSKEQSAPLAVVILFGAAREALRDRRTVAARVRALGLVVGAALLTYAAAWALPLNVNGWIEHHRYLFGEAKYDREFAATLGGFMSLLGEILAKLPSALGLPVLAASLAALLTKPNLRGLGYRMVGCLLYTITFLASVGYVYNRFLLPLLLFCVPLAARSLDVWFQSTAPRARSQRWVWAALLLLAVPGGPLLDWIMVRDTRYAAERWIRDHVPASAVVEIVGNPILQPRFPHEAATIQSPGPVTPSEYGRLQGTYVSLSSFRALDEPTGRTAPTAADVRYETAYVFRGPAIVSYMGVPVSPTIELLRRIESSR